MHQNTLLILILVGVIVIAGGYVAYKYYKNQPKNSIMAGAERSVDLQSAKQVLDGCMLRGGAHDHRECRLGSHVDMC